MYSDLIGLLASYPFNPPPLLLPTDFVYGAISILLLAHLSGDTTPSMLEGTIVFKPLPTPTGVLPKSPAIVHQHHAKTQAGPTRSADGGRLRQPNIPHVHRGAEEGGP